ncbi:MAG: hypothetical protein QGI45_05460 [Myxococcota bacterium]|nr:hypothetical protein [Myxococcota bacterium]
MMNNAGGVNKTDFTSNYDANRDGKVSTQETQKAENLFGIMEGASGDGTLTQDEYQSFLGDIKRVQQFTEALVGFDHAAGMKTPSDHIVRASSHAFSSTRASQTPGEALDTAAYDALQNQFDFIVKADPKSSAASNARWNLISMAQDRGRWDVAAAELKTYSANHPQDAEAGFMLIQAEMKVQEGGLGPYLNMLNEGTVMTEQQVEDFAALTNGLQASYRQAREFISEGGPGAGLALGVTPQTYVDAQANIANIQRFVASVYWSE